ncbi:MAG: glycosyl transferase [Bacteroidia bacterium]|nr:MAG: glycosyl transferase [Bacteroidia bacterium]PIE86527.1 MAG: glycosyl transferase [Bacteroidia bacterium]
MKLSRKQIFHTYFEKLAPTYTKYRKRFKYYWNDIIKYSNYFIHEDDSVLEIGCGTAWTLSKLKGKRKVGIDFSKNMIDVASGAFPEIEFHVMEAENIELNEKFDVVLLSNVIGYFDNILDVFNQLKKVCKPNTRIFITYYNRLWEPILKIGEFFGIKKKIPSQNWLSIGDIQNLLYLSDFESYHSSRRVLIPINIPLLSYLFNKFLARLPFFNYFCINEFVFARPIFQQKKELDRQLVTTVVIPARNESGNIEDAVLRMPKFGKHIEIIFIEGNSTDDTWEKIQEIQQKYKDTHDIKIGQQDGKGKGDAVRKGYAMASGDILMILDADLTVPPEELPKFYEAIASGKGEFINGSRLVYPMEKKAMRPLNFVGNHFFSKMFTWILGQAIKDTLCGTKVMFRKDYEKLAKNRSFFGEFDPFGDYDLLFGAYKLNLKIIDLPIRYKERTYGDTNISRFKHGFLLLRMVAFAAAKIKFW